MYKAGIRTVRQGFAFFGRHITKPIVSKVTQIQARLLGADPAGFQRLAEAYLRAQGYDRINSLCLVLGADKTTRGTPDAFVTCPNGKYVFAEHTTPQAGVHDKFLEELRKCFSEEKTGTRSR